MYKVYFTACPSETKFFTTALKDHLKTRLIILTMCSLFICLNIACWEFLDEAATSGFAFRASLRAVIADLRGLTVSTEATSLQTRQAPFKVH